MSESGVRDRDVAAATAISDELSAIHAAFYGTAVTRARTHILDDVVLAILDIELTPIEQRMIGLGRHEAVLALRHEVQRAEDAGFTAAVERATGRRVIAFLSSTSLEPPFVAELFRLAPRATPAVAAVDRADAS